MRFNHRPIVEGGFLKERCAKLFDGLFQRQAKKQTGKRKQNTDLNSVGIFYCLFCGFVQVVDKVLGLHLQSGGGVSAFGRHGTGISEKREISPQKLFGKLSVPEGQGRTYISWAFAQGLLHT